MNLWLAAARPATLLASVAPVLVGSGLAAGDRVFRFDAFAATLITAVLLNVAVNLANDASDARRGADGPDRVGPVRVVAAGLLSARQVWTATAAVVVVAGAGGAYLATISGWPIIAIGVAAIVALLAYTGGPWPYGYRGLGEVFVFGFFGPVAVVGSRYVHDAHATGAAWLLAVPVGLLATAILVVNNVRDMEIDRTVGKRTLAVVLGRDRTRVFFAGLLWGAFALVAGFAIAALTPRPTLIGLAAVPLAIAPIRAVGTKVSGPELIAALRMTARLHFVVGLLLGVGAAL